MENPQEFLDRNLEELKALQIGEVKVIDGVKLTARTSLGCSSCLFFKCTCNKIIYICKSKDIFMGILEVDENGLTLEDLENEDSSLDRLLNIKENLSREELDDLDDLENENELNMFENM